jgi:hypothetical protein
MLCFIGMKLVSRHFSIPWWPERETNESLKHKIRAGLVGEEIILNFSYLVKFLERKTASLEDRIFVSCFNFNILLKSLHLSNQTQQINILNIKLDGSTGWTLNISLRQLSWFIIKRSWYLVQFLTIKHGHKHDTDTRVVNLGWQKIADC